MEERGRRRWGKGGGLLQDKNWKRRRLVGARKGIELA